jgi:spermidine synthase
VQLHVQDGRDLLQIERRRYDVIISQPSNPWQTGNANLFTREYYRLAAASLAPGGIFSQWVGLYDITPENLQIACRTLVDVFPHTLTFRVDSDLVLLGSFAPLRFNYGNLTTKMALPAVRDVLATAGIGAPGDLLARHYLLDDGNLRRFAASARVNTDDLPILEFSFRNNLGGGMFGEMKKENLAALAPFTRETPVPLADLPAAAEHLGLALQELEQSYLKAGRARESLFFREQSRKYLD